MIPPDMDKCTVFRQTRAIAHLLAISILPWIMVACANIVSPSGGPKDTTPPAVVQMNPHDGSVEFSTNRFVITFNEYVKLDNINQQLLISPPMNELPDFRLKGKSLTVVLRDSLLPDATYAFFFGDAIKDITESNPLSGFSYYFSTGQYLDSLTIRGVVRDALGEKLEDGLLVMLYPASDNDSVVAQFKPRYITKPDKSGTFEFRHVAEGLYRLVALSDLNNNMLYDLITEPVAFKSDFVSPFFLDRIMAKDTMAGGEVVLDTLMHEYKNILYMFTAEDSIQKVMNVRADGKHKISVALKYPLIDPVVLFPDTPLNYYAGFDWNKSNDTLVIWLKDYQSDSIEFILSGAGFSDSISVLFRKPSVGGRGKQVVLPVSARFPVPEGGKLHPDSLPQFFFDRPLLSFDTAGLKLQGAKDSVPLALVSFDTLLNRHFAVGNKLNAGELYSVVIPPGACQAWDSTINDTIRFSWMVGEEADFGDLVVKVFSSDSLPKPWVVLLLNEKGNLIYQKSTENDGTVVFGALSPGSYSLRAFIDNNLNGQWDTGDYYRKFQPEQYFILDNPVVIKEGWTNEVEWITKP